jgi:2-iminobutanoate/2-iminopropanoate deaminase
MSERSEIITVASSQAPAAIGPYSQAVTFGELLFCSGQLPLDPQSATLIDGDIAHMTQRCLENLQAVCRAADTTLQRALKLTIYLCDLAKFKEVNEAYGAFFGNRAPARCTVGVAALPAGAEVEIDAIVAL